MPNTPKPHLRVFVTKTGKFRAEFERKTEDGEKVKGGIMVGGSSWKADDDPAVDSAMRKRIRVKCQRILAQLNTSYEQAFDVPADLQPEPGSVAFTETE